MNPHRANSFIACDVKHQEELVERCTVWVPGVEKKPVTVAEDHSVQMGQRLHNLFYWELKGLEDFPQTHIQCNQSIKSSFKGASCSVPVPVAYSKSSLPPWPYSAADLWSVQSFSSWRPFAEDRGEGRRVEQPVVILTLCDGRQHFWCKLVLLPLHSTHLHVQHAVNSEEHLPSIASWKHVLRICKEPHKHSSATQWDRGDEAD